MNLTEAAKVLYDANPSLSDVLNNAENGKQYKALEPYINGDVLKWLGSKVGAYVPKRDAIWSIINIHNGTTTQLVLPD